MPVSDSCVFCRIVRGELPSTRVYEDDAVVAFLDISPISRGHTLVIPKGHYATLLDLPEDVSSKILPVLTRIGRAVMAAMGADGFNCLQNNFAAAGQIVFHSHWHVIPRFEGDGLAQWPHNAQLDAAAMEAVAEAIRAAL
ncbi:HIT family protein [Desulfovibrio sp. OttesenSCG-928-O18]|nr:HIT family protein [Desulfovibrio sp. OttesenSCG-928-O18]